MPCAKKFDAPQPGLTPGATYTFTITATSSGGTSLPSPATNPIEIDNTGGGGGGAWGHAIEVPGTAALNAGNDATVTSVSCASAGNCAAGGFYTDGSGNAQGFVVSEVNGAWGSAQQVAASLNTGGNAQVYSVSCASAGNCSAGGWYTDGSGHQAFVVSEP